MVLFLAKFTCVTVDSTPQLPINASKFNILLTGPNIACKKQARNLPKNHQKRTVYVKHFQAYPAAALLFREASIIIE